MQEFINDKYRFSSACPLVLLGDDIIEARSNEIDKITSELIEYKVLIRDLIENDISYEIRNEILNIALFITENVELYDKFIESKELPVDEISKETNKLKSYIEKYKQYIIAYVIIFGNPAYRYIREYVQIVENNKDEIGKELIEFKENNLLKGIIIYRNKRSAIIITSLGEFKRIRLLNQCIKGEEGDGVAKKTVSDYKIHIAIILIIITTLTLGITYTYRNIVRTIVVENNALIKVKIQVNTYGRVFDILATTNEGREIIKEIDVVDKEMDTALSTFIEYIDKNNMILDSGIIITISGKPIKYGSIEKSEKYIYNNGINAKLNNVGSEHKIN
ncbi:hypothetical protein [Clostridium celatum]|uniref:anti-sigma-I factor RsgI family protein n=1 Tax=Clostridium celatum TaxID=36834 RepID=UPI002902358B|nr:hypothetical protein [Clostridium celatum]MDU2265340.1 hypothetical protein [Clostridium celatum]MDU6294972.1 hypothetical protein [Clostridium celatum]